MHDVGTYQLGNWSNGKGSVEVLESAVALLSQQVELLGAGVLNHVSTLD